MGNIFSISGFQIFTCIWFGQEQLLFARLKNVTFSERNPSSQVVILTFFLLLIILAKNKIQYQI